MLDDREEGPRNDSGPEARGLQLLWCEHHQEGMTVKYGTREMVEILRQRSELNRNTSCVGFRRETGGYRGWTHVGHRR